MPIQFLHRLHQQRSSGQHVATDAGVDLYDLNYTVSRRLSDTWWLRLGYNMIWLSVALAPDQWDFTNTATSGTTLVGGGGVFCMGEPWFMSTVKPAVQAYGRGCIRGCDSRPTVFTAMI